MNIIDLIIIVPILWFGVKGFRNGAITELIKLVAVFIGLIGASRFSYFLAEYFHIESEYAGLIYFSLTFIAIVGMLFLAAYILNTFIKTIGLSWLNRILGSVFAILRTVLIFSVIIFYFNKIDIEETIFPKEKRDESLLFRPVEKIAPFCIPSLMKIVEHTKSFYLSDDDDDNEVTN